MCPAQFCLVLLAFCSSSTAQSELSISSLYHLLPVEIATDVCVACYESSLGECDPANQTSNDKSYADCCVAREGVNSSTHSYQLDQQNCSLCGTLYIDTPCLSL